MAFYDISGIYHNQYDIKISNTLEHFNEQEKTPPLNSDEKDETPPLEKFVTKCIEDIETKNYLQFNELKQISIGSSNKTILFVAIVNILLPTNIKSLNDMLRTSPGTKNKSIIKNNLTEQISSRTDLIDKYCKKLKNVITKFEKNCSNESSKYKVVPVIERTTSLKTIINEEKITMPDSYTIMYDDDSNSSRSKLKLHAVYNTNFGQSIYSIDKLYVFDNESLKNIQTILKPFIDSNSSKLNCSEFDKAYYNGSKQLGSISQFTCSSSKPSPQSNNKNSELQNTNKSIRKNT